MMATPLWVEALGWTLIHFLWQGALIGLVYACGRGLVERASLRLALGHSALIAMALAPVVTLAWFLDLSGAAANASPASLARGTYAIQALNEAGSARAQDWMTLLVAAWVLGVVLLGVRAGGRWVMLQRLCRRADAASVTLQAAADAIARHMGLARPVPLRVVSALATPIVVGWWRPVILLPLSLCLHLPVRQLELLIAHEIAHVRRWDYLANLLQSALEIVLFYHPAVHWVSKTVREDREHCCDDLVGEHFGNRVAYARALLAVAESQPQPVGGPAFALAATGGVLMPRIERILGVTQRPRQRRRHRVGVLAAVLGAALATLAMDLRRPAAVSPITEFVPASLRLAIEPLPLMMPALERMGPAARLRPRPPNLPSADAAAEVPGAALPVAVPTRPDIDASAMAPPVLALEAIALPISGPAIESSGAVAADPDEPALPRLLRYRAPDYPADALAHGVEGEVMLAFDISAEGRPVDIEVVAIDPPRETAFASAARQALQFWRFERPGTGLPRQSRSFAFRLSEGEDPDRCVVRTGSRLCRGG